LLVVAPVVSLRWRSCSLFLARSSCNPCFFFERDLVLEVARAKAGLIGETPAVGSWSFGVAEDDVAMLDSSKEFSLVTWSDGRSMVCASGIGLFLALSRTPDPAFGGFPASSRGGVGTTSLRPQALQERMIDLLTDWMCSPFLGSGGPSFPSPLLEFPLFTTLSLTIRIEHGMWPHFEHEMGVGLALKSFNVLLRVVCRDASWGESDCSRPASAIRNLTVFSLGGSLIRDPWRESKLSKLDAEVMEKRVEFS